MGVMVCRWTNSVDDEGDGIYYAGAEHLTLFELMQEYLTHGQTVEVLKYDPDRSVGEGVYIDITKLRDNERRAHGEKL